MSELNAFAVFSATDQTITTTTRKHLTDLIMPGVKAGDPVLLIGWADVTHGADTSETDLDIRDGSGIGDTVQGHAAAEDAVAGEEHLLEVMVVVAAYQDDPLYGLNVHSSDASGNGTVRAHTLVGIPLA